MSRRAAGLLVGGLLALGVVAGCTSPGVRQVAQKTPSPTANAVELPTDGCSLLPAGLRDDVVPYAAVNISRRREVPGVSQTLECEMSTDPALPGATTGRLSLTVERQMDHGSRAESAGVAARHFDDLRASYASRTPNPVADLGRAAFQVVDTADAPSRRFRTAVVVLLEVDVVKLTYAAEPSSLQHTSTAGLAVTRYLSAVLDGQRPDPPTSIVAFDGVPEDLPGAALKPNLPVMSVVGPTWAPGDDPQTVVLGRVPFAFRAPKSWSCSRDDRWVDGAQWTCGAPNGEAARPARMRLIVRPCAGGCGEATRSKLDSDWLSGNAPTYDRFDQNTNWYQTTSGGLYNLFLTHYFGEAPGAPLRWQVAAQGQAGEGEQAANLQKVVNDIRSQTP
jgi:hypothetical protein